MDIESSNSNHTGKTSKETEHKNRGNQETEHVMLKMKKKRTKCVVITLTLILLLIIMIIILATTVFKAKHPVTTVQSISIQNLNVAVDVPRFSVDLNVSLEVDISIYNPNRVSFKFQNSTTVINYRGAQVGEVPVPANEIGSRGSLPLNLTLTLMVDRFLSDTRMLLSDVLAGAVPLQTYTRISGKVKLLNVFRFHVVSTTTCDFTLLLSNATVSNQTCKYKTKL